MQIRTSFPWLECLIALAGISLLLQIFPGIWSGSLSAGGWAFWRFLAMFDVRKWTWTVWIGVETLVVFILIGLWAWQRRE